MVITRRRSIALIGLFVAVVMMLGLVAPKHADAASSYEKSLATLINKARASHGRAALTFNHGLSNYARRHSSRMAAKNRIYHNPDLADWLANWSWRILGENVGVGGSVSSLHKAFMASPGHRANNMDRRFRSIGVGMVSAHGRIWVTVIFKG